MVATVASILTQLSRAVSRAHALGIIHRDIKPDNIFLIDSDGDLFVKVLDFGIAKREADDGLSMTSTGMAVGTPHYMSPEQIVSAKDVTLATDLWALGAVAYRALTGRLPFAADTYGALCIMINTGEFSPACTLRPELPAALDAWFARALHRSPSGRFASVKELADQFHLAAGFAPGQAISVPAELPEPDLRASAAESDSQSPGSGAGTVTAPPGFVSQSEVFARSTTGGSLPGAAVTGWHRPQPSRTTGVVVSFVLVAALVGAAVVVLRPSAQTSTNASAGFAAAGEPVRAASPPGTAAPSATGEAATSPTVPASAETPAMPASANTLANPAPPPQASAAVTAPMVNGRAPTRPSTNRSGHSTRDPRTTTPTTSPPSSTDIDHGF